MLSILFSFSSFCLLKSTKHRHCADPGTNCQESNLVVPRILLFDPGQKAKIVVTFLLVLRYINSVRKFRAFYDKYKDMFFAYLIRSTGDYYLASDIMQESFTRYLELYGKDSQSAALLYTIGRNLIYDNARRQKRNAQLQSDRNNPADDHEHYLMVRDQYRQVLSAMQTLKADERDILALTVSSQLSYREISSIVGTSEANVKVKVHRARAKLRQIIQAGE
jgi:RNA polymerase sigma-70 factor (ECF subfamily)